MTSHRVARLFALAALTLGTLTAQAQGTETPRVDQRQANQDKRIDQGVASGQLTKREAARLERQQSRIDKAEAVAKADGTVTKKERAKLHHMQDHASADIARQKHDRQHRKPTTGN